MYNGRLRSTNKRENESENIQNHENKRLKGNELPQIVEFDLESWKKIFTYLDDTNLANVACVCKSFHSLAQERFQKKHKSFLRIQTNLIGWKPIVCRFKNVISILYLIGPTIPDSDRILDFFAKFLTKSLKQITFVRAHVDQFTNLKFRRKFHKLESLSFVACQLNDPQKITELGQWCPNLKSLTLSACTVRNTTFFEQFIPSLEDVTLLDTFRGVTNDILVNFFTLNNQLKRIAIDLPYAITSRSLSVVNEKLMNLETMKWRCGDLDLLPTFQQNFKNLSELTILMEFSGVCKNQLLAIVKHLPKIELIQVVNCKENSMTNDDLVELVTECSTLKTFEIYSVSLKRELEFGYDLHRRICHATSNRTNIYISVNFDFPFPTTRFEITKQWIKENSRLIVLAPEDLSNY